VAARISPRPLRVRRCQRDHRRADGHQQQRESQRGATARAVGIRSDDGCSERPRHEPGSKRRQRAEEPTYLRLGREERVADHDGEECVNEKVVELEPVADDNGDYGFQGQPRLTMSRGASDLCVGNRHHRERR
jgi:hypothetical protein